MYDAGALVDASDLSCGEFRSIFLRTGETVKTNRSVKPGGRKKKNLFLGTLHRSANSIGRKNKHLGCAPTTLDT